MLGTVLVLPTSLHRFFTRRAPSKDPRRLRAKNSARSQQTPESGAAVGKKLMRARYGVVQGTH